MLLNILVSHNAIAKELVMLEPLSRHICDWRTFKMCTKWCWWLSFLSVLNDRDPSLGKFTAFSCCVSLIDNFSRHIYFVLLQESCQKKKQEKKLTKTQLPSPITWQMKQVDQTPSSDSNVEKKNSKTKWISLTQGPFHHWHRQGADRNVYTFLNP